MIDMYLSLSAFSEEVVPLHVMGVMCVIYVPGLKCQLSEDCASSVINDLNCYVGVVLNPVSLYPLHVVWCGVI